MMRILLPLVKANDPHGLPEMRVRDSAVHSRRSGHNPSLPVRLQKGRLYHASAREHSAQYASGKDPLTQDGNAAQQNASMPSQLRSGFLSRSNGVPSGHRLSLYRLFSFQLPNHFTVYGLSNNDGIKARSPGGLNVESNRPRQRTIRRIKMALSLGISNGAEIEITNGSKVTMLVVNSINGSSKVQIDVGGEVFNITDLERVEILPEVFVSLGKGPSARGYRSARLAFEAPLAIKINRVKKINGNTL